MPANSRSFPLAAIPISIIGLAASVHGQCDYDVTVVDAGPDCRTFGLAMNSHGHVAGYFRCGVGDNEPYVWSAADGFMPLPTLPGYPVGVTSDINDHGQVVGTFSTTVPFTGFLFEDGEYTLLRPAPGGAYSWANAINNAGQVVGRRSIGEGVHPQSAFVWSRADGFTDLGLMDDVLTSAVDISESGQVLGYRGIFGSTEEGFVWSDDGHAEFFGETPGGGTSGVRSINKFGVVSGTGSIPVGVGGDIVLRAFRWQGCATPLDSLETHPNCTALAMSDLGQAVGQCSVDASDIHGVLWQGDAVYDLNDLAPFDGEIERACDLNDSGQIIGLGKDAVGRIVALLLEPRAAPTGDITKDCRVDTADLILLLTEWGSNDSPADIDGDGTVGSADLVILLFSWA